MLVVATYSNLDTHQGLITCWNVQNIHEPDMAISTSNNPTHACFSPNDAHLFAVGFQSGQVQIVAISSRKTQLRCDQIVGETIIFC